MATSLESNARRIRGICQQVPLTGLSGPPPSAPGEPPADFGTAVPSGVRRTYRHRSAKTKGDYGTKGDRDPARQGIQLWVREGTTDENAFSEVIEQGGYEVRSRGFKVEEAATWLDLGSHIGTFACLAFARGCEVVAFEPHGENCRLLEHNVRALPAGTGSVGSKGSRVLRLHQAGVVSAALRAQEAGPDGTMQLLTHPNPMDTYRHTLMSEKGQQNGAARFRGPFGGAVPLPPFVNTASGGSNGIDGAAVRCNNCGKGYKKKGVCVKKHEVQCGKKGSRVRMAPKVVYKVYDRGERVPVFTLEEVLRAYPEVDAVKIDVEGVEIELLEEVEDWGSVKRLVFEYSFEYDPDPGRFRALLACLSRHFTGGVVPSCAAWEGLLVPRKRRSNVPLLVHASTEPLAPVRRIAKRPSAAVCAARVLKRPAKRVK